MRSILLLLLILLIAPARAQDWDVYVDGTIVDSGTGGPIPFAQIKLIHVLDTVFNGGSVADEKGGYEVVFYSGWSVDDALYKLEFSAEGYGSRQAVLDLRGVDKGKTNDLVWRITVDVRLEADSGSTLGQLVGICEWDARIRNIACRSPEGATQFVVKKQAEKSFDVHAALLSTLWGIPGLLLDGVVKEHWSGKVLEGSVIRVETLGGAPYPRGEVKTDKYGYYALVLPFDGDYIVHYSRNGMVGKSVRIITSGITEEARMDGFRAVVDIRLFKPIANADLDFLKEPLGVMSFDPTEVAMKWDMDISGPLLRRLDSVLEPYSPLRAKRK